MRGQNGLSPLHPIRRGRTRLFGQNKTEPAQTESKISQGGKNAGGRGMQGPLRLGARKSCHRLDFSCCSLQMGVELLLFKLDALKSV